MIKSNDKFKSIRYYSIYLLLFCFSSNLSAQTQDYQIQRGDILDIMVMEHPEFSISNIIVLPDGKLQFPAIGFVKAAGISPVILSDTLQAALTKYVVDPIVTVYVKQIKNQYINILGELNRPGQYQIFEPTDIMSAISLAGGFRNIRKVKFINIIRGNNEREKVKMEKFMETPEIYSFLKPGDTIYVETKNAFNWSRLSFFTTLLYTIAMVINISK